jgi:PAS domain S-box-containing protein
VFHPHDDPSRFLAATVDSSDDAIVGKDLEGIIVSWNRGAERLYGFTAPQVTGRSITVLTPADRQHELATVMVQIRAGARVPPYETVRQTAERLSVAHAATINPDWPSGGGTCLSIRLPARTSLTSSRHFESGRLAAE